MTLKLSSCGLYGRLTLALRRNDWVRGGGVRGLRTGVSTSPLLSCAELWDNHGTMGHLWDNFWTTLGLHTQASFVMRRVSVRCSVHKHGPWNAHCAPKKVKDKALPDNAMGQRQKEPQCLLQEACEDLTQADVSTFGLCRCFHVHAQRKSTYKNTDHGKRTKSDPEPRNHRFIPSMPLWQDQPVCVYMLDIECFHKAKHKASKDYNPFDILEDIQYTSHLQCLFQVLTDERPWAKRMDCVWFEGKTPRKLFWGR